MKLNARQKREVKRVARELLIALKTEKLVLDWRRRMAVASGMTYHIITGHQANTHYYR